MVVTHLLTLHLLFVYFLCSNWEKWKCHPTECLRQHRIRQCLLSCTPQHIHPLSPLILLLLQAACRCRAHIRQLRTPQQPTLLHQLDIQLPQRLLHTRRCRPILLATHQVISKKWFINEIWVNNYHVIYNLQVFFLMFLLYRTTHWDLPTSTVLINMRFVILLNLLDCILFCMIVLDCILILLKCTIVFYKINIDQ